VQIEDHGDLTRGIGNNTIIVSTATRVGLKVTAESVDGLLIEHPNFGAATAQLNLFIYFQ